MHQIVWTCPIFDTKKLRLKIHRMENLSHGVIAKEVHERVQNSSAAAIGSGGFDCGSGASVRDQSEPAAPLAEGFPAFC
jgi:hypothetical protein